MSRYQIGPYEDREQAIRRLKDELWITRRALLNRAPLAFHEILSSYLDCDSRSATYRWLDVIAGEIVEHAAPLPASVNQSRSPRAMCPLCGDGANSYYEEGFAFPEGLRRHLVGYGRASQCVFTDAAMKLARDDWFDKFSEEEEKKRQESTREKEGRRKLESLYRIGPFGDPRLIDEDSFYGSGARAPQEMREVEERLTAIGLTHVVDGKVEAWIDEQSAFVVYADPRQRGRIDFSVWRKPLPKRSGSNAYKYRISSFHILDSWKNDLKRKYEARLPTAT